MRLFLFKKNFILIFIFQEKDLRIYFVVKSLTSQAVAEDSSSIVSVGLLNSIFNSRTDLVILEMVMSWDELI